MATTTSAEAQQPKRADNDTKSPPWSSSPPPRVYGGHNFFHTQEEYFDIYQHVHAMFSMPDCKRGLVELMQDGFTELHGVIQGWTFMWARHEPMSHLSTDDKREIIASLDGYCVQEDWESIQARLPPPARANMGAFLAETMLYQHLFAKFIDSPFWFLDGRTSATMPEEDLDFHRKFQYLYERLRQGSAYSAAWWKSATIANCNAMSGTVRVHGRSELARSTTARRGRMVKLFTDELLGRRLFQLLLKPKSPAEVAIREEQLHDLLDQAAEHMIYTEGGIFGNSTVDRLPGLSTFHYQSTSVVPHQFHFTSQLRTPSFGPTEGGRILIVTRPGLSYDDRLSLGPSYKLPSQRFLPAQVLAEVPKKELKKGSKKGQNGPQATQTRTAASASKAGTLTNPAKRQRTARPVSASKAAKAAEEEEKEDYEGESDWSSLEPAERQRREREHPAFGMTLRKTPWRK
ncbi:hypothetical protein BO78DRAFT_465406 [Aspergillus sclerotiicarbonarius CBS 121057]|uniref:Uncharacterized protein n=1 Tax=Aspergillus sclerotiicarbonarius (strain CBS 121057 / IBT 28362) TaxID=1448318 RepID=A0A319F5B3_ASPSB|nr:hypothetical protein BO78DRAFT_465406 [Aspergillus sclerotiicarbonarius CBS 121057]